MNDDEARLARELSLVVGKWDWWNLPDLHSPQEWAVQIAANMIDPIGESRADFRAAVNTAQIVMALAANPLDEDRIRAIISALRGYLPANREANQVVGPAAIRQALGE